MHSEKLSTELKMLTSTMQFTSNEHTQPSSSPITPPPARDPLRGTVMKDCHAFGKKLFQASDPSSRPTRLFPASWSAPSGPNSASPSPPRR
ncbi:hypothetical protein J2S57_000368 [Kineosporia succinea]|uniref:Uncharacterized protein n=1 Tax=Kineosporia succinea TaxID=84632 RepID=A0ABT9NW20_9ACTN|nr:hypothetical protein [Kineosporia succinea]